MLISTHTSTKSLEKELVPRTRSHISNEVHSNSNEHLVEDEQRVDGMSFKNACPPFLRALTDTGHSWWQNTVMDPPVCKSNFQFS